MNNYAIDCISNGKRADERAFDEYRKIVIKTGVVAKAEGSASVTMGETKIIAGVKIDVGEPFPDTPGEGTIIVNAEFTPLASPDFEAGPPDENATELARVVDRGIRESECIDLKSISLLDSEKVLSLYIDIHIINDCGNLIDCSFLAALAALMDSKIPKVEDGVMLRNEYEKDLEVFHTPTEVTVCKIGGKLVLDPTIEEERGVDAKLTVCVREDDSISALQKQGVVGLTMEETKEMIEIAIKKSKELRKLLKSKKEK